MILRQLAGDLPLLAHYFHIPPWEIPKLTVTQLNAFLAALPKTRGSDGDQHA